MTHEVPFRLVREDQASQRRAVWLRYFCFISYHIIIFVAAVVAVILTVIQLLILEALGFTELSDGENFPGVCLLANLAVVTLAVLPIRPKLLQRYEDARRRAEKLADIGSLLDSRPILFLRCFVDDELISMSSNSPMGAVRIEEEIAKAARKVGPMIALGRPHERLPHIGAKRFYVADEDWQKAVGHVLSVCSYAVIVYHGGANVLWEVRETLATVEPRRIILVFPIATDRKAPWHELLTLSNYRAAKAMQRERVVDASRNLSKLGFVPPPTGEVGEIMVFDRERRARFLPRRNRGHFYLFFAGLVQAPITPLVAYIQSPDESLAKLIGATAVATIVAGIMGFRAVHLKRFTSYSRALKPIFAQSGAMIRHVSQR